MQEVCRLYRALMASVVKDAWSGEPSNTRTQAPGETRRASTAGGGVGYGGGKDGRILQGGLPLLSDLNQDMPGNVDTQEGQGHTAAGWAQPLLGTTCQPAGPPP